MDRSHSTSISCEPSMKIKITGGEVEVDEADVPIVAAHSWYVNEHGYAVSRIGGRLVRMHKLLTGTDRQQHVDHRMGNGLDNRRSEIRLASRNQNMWNSAKKNRGGNKLTSSQYKGVSFSKAERQWVAEVWKNSRKVFRKGFTSESFAAFAYNIVAEREFGEFARINRITLGADDSVIVKDLVESYKPRGPSKGGCVSFSKQWGRWILRKRVDRKMKYIGSFSSREEAEAERDRINIQQEGIPVL